MLHAGAGSDIPQVQFYIRQQGDSHGGHGVQKQVRPDSHKKRDEESCQVLPETPEYGINCRVEERVMEQCPVSRE